MACHAPCVAREAPPMIDHVQIGPIRYAVHLVEDLHDFDSDGKRQGLDGHIKYGSCEVQIEQILNPQRALQVLWHEVLHGIMTGAGLGGHDEKTIEVLSHGLVDVLQRNPDLVKLTLGDLNEATGSRS